MITIKTTIIVVTVIIILVITIIPALITNRLLGIFKQFIIQNVCQEKSCFDCRIKYFSNMHKFQLKI